MKKEKGSVTLFILIACMFMIVILLIVNIGIMNKNRSEEKKIEEIAKQYNQNETDLDDAYKKAVDENEYLTKSEILELIQENSEYHSGDSCMLHATTGGFVMDEGTAYVCNVYLDKKINKEVKSITVNSIAGVVIMQNGKYLLGSLNNMATDGFLIDEEVKLNKTENDLNGNFLEIIIRVPTKHKDVVNNDAIGVVLSRLSITFN